MTVQYKPADATSAEAQHLFGEIGKEMTTLYGEDVGGDFVVDDVQGGRGLFIIAYTADGEAIGCGALRPVTQTQAEVKRVYVRPQGRGKGIAKGIMDVIEQHALDLGYTHIKLETGTLQPAAVHIYETRGYERIPCYGKYADDPLSVCFEKAL